MAVQSQPTPAADVLRRPSDPRVRGRRQRGAELHLLTYLVGNAIVLTLWAALSVSADAWYWWLVAPVAWWTIAVALHVWHAYRVTPQALGRYPGRCRVAALVLVAGLVAGPVGTHVYWMLGGTWGLHGTPNSAGIKIVAAVVVLGLVGAVSVVLARAALWRPAFLPDRLIRPLTWALGVFFLGHGAVSLAEGAAGMEVEWWLYGPCGLVIGLLAVAVASSGDGRPRRHRAHRSVASH